MTHKIRTLLLIVPLLLGIDGFTKHSARNLELGQRVDVVDGWFAWTHAENPFIAFSLPIPMGVIVVAGLAMVGWLIWELARLPAGSAWRAAGLGAMLAGAIGNLVDRLGDGTVTDMLLLYTEHPTLAPWLRATFGTASWPIFNIADVALLGGVGLFLLGSGLEDGEPTDVDQALET